MWEGAVLGVSVNVGASTGAGKQEMEEGAKSPLPSLLFLLLINEHSRLQPIILNCFSKGFLLCDIQESKLTFI